MDYCIHLTTLDLRIMAMCSLSVMFIIGLYVCERDK